MPNSPTQLSLFPAADSVESLMAEAKAQLPIDDENTLVALLHKHQNTILKQLEQPE